MSEHPLATQNGEPDSDPTMHSSPEVAFSGTTGLNHVFRIASIVCAGLQVVLYVRHVLVLYRPHGDFSLETVLAALPTLALQIVGCACALGAGTHKISCIIWNIAISTICLLLLFVA